MKKLVIVCPTCTKKMKISNKIAKYKCPSCSAIYKFNLIKFILINIEKFFMTIIDTLLIFPKKTQKKYKDTVATYKYMKQVRTNMKNDPNWSNFRKQQEEEKTYSSSSKSSFFDKLKNKFKK